MNTEPTCYECKRQWSTEYIIDTFGVSFRTKTLRIHRRKIVMERERSLLPSMQTFVEIRQQMKRVEADLNKIQPVFVEVAARYNQIRQSMLIAKNIYQSLSVKLTLTAEETETLRIAKRDFAKYSVELGDYTRETYMSCSKEYNRLLYIMQKLVQRYRTGEEMKERREFIMRCPAADCRGFLSTAYKCGTCSKRTCAECMEILPEDGGDQHTCNPESVESTKAIKKETRPCPKCAAPIYKIDGCDQMWCTYADCNTAFSWTTGQVVSGRVHNPHYYEWVRRTGGGAAPREIGDIPCGGIPAYTEFSRLFYSKYTLITSKTRSTLFEIHRHCVEIEEALVEYPQQMPALTNKDIDVQYLMNIISEERWIQLLEHEDTKFQRRREYGQILQTLVTATADILRNVHMRMAEPGTQPEIPTWLQNEIIPTLQVLRQYTNDTFNKFGSANRCAVPQISERWNVLPARKTSLANRIL
jgi:hypothetical protein